MSGESTNKTVKQIIAEELMKCAINPVYFMRKFGIIQHPTRGKVLFNLYDFQEDTLTGMSQHRFNVILKSRQMGISTLVAAYALWCMLFNDDFNILVIATTQEVAKNLVTKVRIMHENLPAWLRGITIEDNKLSLRFKNGSQIKAVSSAGTSGRSEALSLLIIDEAAFIQKIDEIWTAAQQTLATGGGCIALSTPNGTGNWFHQKWVDAEKGGQFNPIKLHWSLHPDRDQAWRDLQTELLGERMAAQECDCDFITSGHTVVPGEILEWYRLNTAPPIEKRGPGGTLWIWEYPDYTKTYVVVADVARGDGSDYSAFHIFNIEDMVQVAEYEDKLGTTDYGNLLFSIATEYNNALLVVENANIGWATLQVLIDRHYPNLYYSYKDDGYIDENKHLARNYDLKDKSQMIPGHTTSTRTRPLQVTKIETYMKERTPVIRSSRLISQLFVFVWKASGRAEAQNGYNDDLVMAFGIGLYIRDTALRLRQQGLELTLKAVSRIGKSDGVYTSTNVDNGSWSQPMPQGGSESLTWLIQ